MQPQGHVQMVVNQVDYGLNPQASLDAPRWQWLRGRQVLLEPGVPQHVLLRPPGAGAPGGGAAQPGAVRQGADHPAPGGRSVRGRERAPGRRLRGRLLTDLGLRGQRGRDVGAPRRSTREG